MRGSRVAEASILYGDYRRQTNDPLAVGGTPWPSNEYLDYFEELPERRLYLENRDPEEIKIILAGPIWEQQIGYKSDDDIRQSQDLITLTPFGFSTYVRSRQWYQGRQEVKFQRERGYSHDLDRFLEYFAELQQQRAHLGEYSSNRPKHLQLLKNGTTAPTAQEFHDQFMTMLAGKITPEPLTAFPIIREDDPPSPEIWKRRLPGGSIVHKRLKDDAWLRISISGWNDNSSEPGIDLQGIVGKLSVSEAEELWAGQTTNGTRRRLADAEMPALYEYPGLLPGDCEYDPRVADMICGTEHPSHGYPIYG